MQVLVNRGACAAAILFLVTACGGGGGGGGGPTTPPTTPPTTNTEAVVNAANVFEVVALGNAFLESSLQIGVSALDNVFDLNDSRQTTANMSCGSFGGSGTMQLTDNNADGLVSSGDSVTLNYSDCLQVPLGDPATGSIVVDIVSLTINSDRSTTGEVQISIPSGLSFNSSGLSVNARGAFTARFTATSSIENLNFETGASESLRIDISDGTSTFIEVATNLVLTREIDAAGNYRITGSADIDSDLVSGTLACAVSSDLVGAFFNFPDSGTLTCTGRNNSAARVVAVSANGIRTEVDPEGDGTFVDAGVITNGNGLWADYIEGTLIGTRIDRPAVSPGGLVPTVASESLAIDVTDVAYDAVNNRLYVTNDTGLTVIDPATMAVADSVALADRPAALAVSDDGSTVWLGFLDAPEMVSVDTQTLTPGTRVPLGLTGPGGFDRFVRELRVAPGTTDTVIVSIVGDDQLVAYTAGVQLPTIVEDQLVPTLFEFRDAGTIIGIDDSITNFPATVISLDANGLTLDKTLEEFSRNFNARLSLENGRAWINYGRVFDVDAEVINGRVDFSQIGLSSFRHGVLTDETENRVYFYQSFDDVLDFYDTQTLTAVGAYRITTSGDFVEMLASANDEIFLVLDTEVHRVNKTLLTPTFLSRSCVTIDLSGQLGADFFVQIDCAFNDAIYDAARGVIYATVPSAAGPDGNSVAVIDPATGSIQSYIFVGSEPTSLSMSGSGNRLYVALSETNQVAEVDLQTQTLAGNIAVSGESVFGRPQMPFEVKASPVSDLDFLLATERQVAAYSSGTQAVNIESQADSIQNLFYSSDASRAYAVDLSRTLWSFDVDSTGLTNAVEMRNTDLLTGVKMKDGVLYDRLGSLVDPETAALIGTCPDALATGVEPDPDSDDIFYFTSAFDSEIVVCDRGTLTTGNPFVVPRFGDGFQFRALTKAGANRIAIVGNTKLLLLDPAEF